MADHTLTENENEELRFMLASPGDVIVTVWGEGKHQHVSFYLSGTRLEVRLPVPKEDWE